MEKAQFEKLAKRAGFPIVVVVENISVDARLVQAGVALDAEMRERLNIDIKRDLQAAAKRVVNERVNDMKTMLQLGLGKKKKKKE